MLSSQDEACKLELRSEKISYHSVHSNSVFSNDVARRSAGNVSFLGRLHKTFHKKSCIFFPGEKVLGMVMWRVILVILGMIMLLLLTYN